MRICGGRFSIASSAKLVVWWSALQAVVTFAAAAARLEQVPQEYDYDAVNNIMGTGNSIVQSYQFYTHPKPEAIPRPPSGGNGVLDGENNPRCDDKVQYFAYSVTEDDMNITGVQFTVFLPDTHEIRPVLLVKLKPGQKSGFAAIQGPGIRVETWVDNRNVVRTVCGSWITSPTGYYSFELTDLARATARVLYYVRKRESQEEPVYLEYPIDVEMEVESRVFADEHDVEVYVGVVADWATRVVDIEVEQFVAHRPTYQQALENSLAADGLGDLGAGEYEYDYYYYYDQFEAGYDYGGAYEALLG
mmetsp:Transcript_38871/g.110004  ORF Transcript_38871/g.110004 Transcript_38871/m.110004 type:complete len:304 (-) Transcript_38871:278-1189(-)